MADRTLKTRLDKLKKKDLTPALKAELLGLTPPEGVGFDADQRDILSQLYLEGSTVTVTGNLKAVPITYKGKQYLPAYLITDGNYSQTELDELAFVLITDYVPPQVSL